MSSDALAEVVAVIDRLVSPGGCPWDAEQTHASLVPYLIEEAYEVVDAIESAPPDPVAADAHLAEELGDVLLQVVFHARLAAGRSAFDIDDVARGLVAKLVRRHPHVFADPAGAAAGGAAAAVDAAGVAASWEDLKAVEKPDRGLFEGLATGLPALARAGKVVARFDRAGLDPAAALGVASDDPGEAVATALFSLVIGAQRAGVDAESALRLLLGRVEHTVTTPRPIEHSAGDDRPSQGAAPSH